MGDVEHEGAPAVACKGSDARLVTDDMELRRQLVQLIPTLAKLVTPPAPAGGRVAMFAASMAVLLAAFWFAVDYGSEYAAPLLPNSLQAKLGESVYDEITADKEECHGKAGLAAINGLANRLAKAELPADPFAAPPPPFTPFSPAEIPPAPEMLAPIAPASSAARFTAR